MFTRHESFENSERAFYSESRRIVVSWSKYFGINLEVSRIRNTWNVFVIIWFRRNGLAIFKRRRHIAKNSQRSALYLQFQFNTIHFCTLFKKLYFGPCIIRKSKIALFFPLKKLFQYKFIQSYLLFNSLYLFFYYVYYWFVESETVVSLRTQQAYATIASLV